MADAAASPPASRRLGRVFLGIACVEALVVAGLYLFGWYFR
jgi:hypothetical protein